jgi:hypothetical protein
MMQFNLVSHLTRHAYFPKKISYAKPASNPKMYFTFDNMAEKNYINWSGNTLPNINSEHSAHNFLHKHLGWPQTRYFALLAPYKNEKEILFLPYTKFKVIFRGSSTDTKPGIPSEKNSIPDPCKPTKVKRY